MAHKTFSGMIRAVDTMVARLDGVKIGDQREYDATNKQVDALLAELNGLWSNPADASDASKAKARLLNAWHHATT